MLPRGQARAVTVNVCYLMCASGEGTDFCTQSRSNGAARDCRHKLTADSVSWLALDAQVLSCRCHRTNAGNAFAPVHETKLFPLRRISPF